MSSNDYDSFEQHRQVLTAEIREHVGGARAKGLHRIRVNHAVECGRALSQLKELLKHGEWDQWVEERLNLSRSTANRYMRLARHVDRLTRYMTIREAYLAAGVINPKKTPGTPAA